MAKTFSSLQRQNLTEQVVREIGLSIMRNDFKPGDTLASEPELSLQFQVSRPVLREALKILSSKGLLESRPKTGTRIRPRAAWNILDPGVIDWLFEVGPDPSFLDALCEMRLMFEPMAARLATTRATDEEIQTIEECYRRMDEGVSFPDAYIPADLAFHAAICAAAHNEILQKITATLTTSLQVSRIITSRLPGANLAAMPVHRAVMEAIRQRDEQAAEASMRKLVILTTDDIHRALGYEPESKQ
ncbi:MAG TPA: FadR/GntR family transcriptional regulator [Ktedonobacteraceae bacterium]|nr:FadR/GntR family transcriptional regulator [Ktedonobacteraceae bacterium]